MERRIELKTASELRTDTIPAVESTQAYRSLQLGKLEKPGSGHALPLYLLFQIQSCFANLQETCHKKLTIKTFYFIVQNNTH